jgi:hypothetical protein
MSGIMHTNPIVHRMELPKLVRRSFAPSQIGGTFGISIIELSGSSAFIVELQFINTKGGTGVRSVLSLVFL